MMDVCDTHTHPYKGTSLRRMGRRVKADGAGSGLSSRLMSGGRIPCGVFGPRSGFDLPVDKSVTSVNEDAYRLVSA